MGAHRVLHHMSAERVLDGRWRGVDAERWCRGILHLLEHELDLRHFFIPATAAQKAKQGIIDRQSLLLLSQ